VLDDLAANDNQPSGNSDPRVELFGLIQLLHPIDQRQPASCSALSVVLVRPRISEINQDSITHITGDKPPETLDRLGDAAVIRAHDPAQILGIESRRQRRRADKIAEHHSQLTAFRSGTDQDIGDGRGLQIEHGNRVEQSAAVAD
jgi:hypothetical protein